MTKSWGKRNHQHQAKPQSPYHPPSFEKPSPTLHSRKSSPVLCGPDPLEDCAQNNWPRAHLKGPEKNSYRSGWYSWQQLLLPQHPLGQVLGWGGIEALGMAGAGEGGQKDPGFLKPTMCSGHKPHLWQAGLQRPLWA